MTSQALAVRGLTVAYRQQLALERVTVGMRAGCITGLIGPNGAGKSTLLKAAVGLLPVRAGTVAFFGAPLARVRRRVGYMPQTAEVDWDFPTTVGDVVRMGRFGRRGWWRPLATEDHVAADAALERLGIAELAGRPINELSGGQKQRTFMARILAQDPDLFLLDEPLAGVDVATERSIAALLQELRDEGRTIVLVHHDLGCVRGLADEVVLLRQGHLVESGSTGAVLTDDNLLRAYGACDRLAS